MKTISIWAGSDLFAVEQMRECDDMQAMYQQVLEHFLPQMVDTFGSGVELQMTDDRTFRINVDHVEVG
jgi:hypothetical protein